jgi:hypothetical protein
MPMVALASTTIVVLIFHQACCDMWIEAQGYFYNQLPTSKDLEI